MRRTLVTALAVPVLLLSACGGDNDPEVVDTTTNASENTTEDTTEDTTTDAVEETADEAVVTEEPTDDAVVTEEPTEDSAEETTKDEAAGADLGGADGEAAGDKTKEWLVAFVNGEEEVCDLMLDFEGEGPMEESKTDYEICLATLPSMASSIFDAETVGIIESMEINGASVDGDKAIVGRDNFSALFAKGMGDDVITLKKIDDVWYVDMDKSFN